MADENCKPNVSFTNRGLSVKDDNGNCHPLQFKVNSSGLTRNAIRTLIERFAHFGPIYFLDASTGDYWKFDVAQDGTGNMEQTNVGPVKPVL